LPCPHFPNCVGCSWIGRAYGEQLAGKQARVHAAFAGFSSLSGIAIPEVVGAPRPFGYRNQAKLVARRAGRGLLLGIYRPGTHQVVDIRQCPVHHPLITQTLEHLIPVLEDSGISIYDERNHQGSLRYVVVRAGTWSKSTQIILVTTDAVLPHARELVPALRRLPGVASIVHNINATAGNTIFGPRFIPLTKQGALIERIGDLKLKTHAGAFLQANIPMARRIYEHACREACLTGKTRALDLYCGAGALTLHLARDAHFVAGIETSAIAVSDAKANVRLNGFHNVRFYAGSTADTLAGAIPQLGPIDVVTLNPPRKGADTATRQAIVGLHPGRIVYVSCDPQSLARDLDWFHQHGYATARVQPFDLLPQTEHVECVATLERASANGNAPSCNRAR
jgi:23S rRNA (uracil1939-C5)-methyltransferase